MDLKNNVKQNGLTRLWDLTYSILSIKSRAPIPIAAMETRLHATEGRIRAA